MLNFELHNRFLAICHPFLVQQDANERSVRRRYTRRTRSFFRLKTCHIGPSAKRLYRYTFAALAVSIFSNIPIFLEFTTTPVESGNLTVKISVSPMRLNIDYIVFYKNFFEGVVLMVLPLTTMIYFNVKIIYALVKRHTTILATSASNSDGKNEVNLAVLLVAMNFVFLVCNSGRVVVNFWEIFHIVDIKECMAMKMPYKVSI